MTNYERELQRFLRDIPADEHSTARRIFDRSLRASQARLDDSLVMLRARVSEERKQLLTVFIVVYMVFALIALIWCAV